MPFSEGDIVRVSNSQSLAYGRFGRINSVDPILLEFLDLPVDMPDGMGKTIKVNENELALIEPIEPATSGVTDCQFLYFSAVVATRDSGFRECGIVQTASIQASQKPLEELVVQAWGGSEYQYCCISKGTYKLFTESEGRLTNICELTVTSIRVLTLAEYLSLREFIKTYAA